MQDGPIRLVFPAPKVLEGLSDSDRDDALGSADDEDVRPKKKRKKGNDGKVVLTKGKRTLTDADELPLYEVDDADRLLSLEALQAKFSNLHLIVTFEVAWPILTGTYAMISKITDPIWKTIQFVASHGKTGVPATVIGRTFGCDQRKVDALCRGAIEMHILYKKKTVVDGVTVNVVYHRAFWDAQEDRPKAEIEAERDAVEGVLNPEDLLNAPLIEKRIMRALEKNRAMLQTHLATAIGIFNFRLVDHRRFRRFVDQMVTRGALRKTRLSTAHAVVVYLPSQAGEAAAAELYNQPVAQSPSAEDDEMHDIHPAVPEVPERMSTEVNNVEPDGQEQDRPTGHLLAHIPIARQILDKIKVSGRKGTTHDDLSQNLDRLEIRCISRIVDKMIANRPPDYLAGDALVVAKSRNGREEHYRFFTESNVQDQAVESDDEPIAGPSSKSLPPVNPKRFYNSSDELRKYLKPLQEVDWEIDQLTGKRARLTAVKKPVKPASAGASGGRAAGSSNATTGERAESPEPKPKPRRGRPPKTAPAKDGKETYYARRKRELAERAAQGLPPPPKRPPHLGGRRPKGWVPPPKEHEPTPMILDSDGENTDNHDSRNSAAGALEQSAPTGPVASTSGSQRKVTATSPSHDRSVTASTSQVAELIHDVSNNEQHHTPPKRKRGRPRKVQTVAESHLSEEDDRAGSIAPEPVKRKRGRPRKHPLPDTEVYTSATTNMAKGMPESTVSKHGTVESRQAPEQDVADTPSTSHSVPSTLGQELVPGMPSAISTSSNMMPPPQPPEPVKRKRGRPRKHPLPASATESSEAVETTAVGERSADSIDAGQGHSLSVAQPSQVANTSMSDAEASAQEPIKRKRGLPRKNPLPGPPVEPSRQLATRQASEPQEHVERSVTSTSVSHAVELPTASMGDHQDDAAASASHRAQPVASTSRQIDTLTDLDAGVDDVETPAKRRRVESDSPADASTVVAPIPSSSKLKKAPKRVIELSHLEKERDIMSYIKSEGGIVDYTASYFPEHVRRHIDQRRQEQGLPAEKQFTMDRKFARKLLDKLVNAGKLRMQTVLVGNSGQMRRQLYYDASIAPDSEQFIAFLESLQQALLPPPKELRKQPDKLRERSASQSGEPGLAKQGIVRTLDEPTVDDDDTTVQRFFHETPKIFGTRFGAFRGKNAQMRVFHGAMFDIVERQKTDNVFHMAWLFTKMTLRTFLYLIDLPDDASDDVEQYLRASANYNVRIEDLPSAVSAFIGIFKTATRLRLFQLMDTMQEIGVIDSFEIAPGASRTGSAAAKASKCILAAHAPVYRLRAQEQHKRWLVDVVELSSRAKVNAFWRRLEEYSVPQRAKRNRRSIDSDIFPKMYPGSAKLAKTLRSSAQWYDTSKLRHQQRDYVDKIIAANDGRMLSQDTISKLAKLMYATHEAVFNYVSDTAEAASDDENEQVANKLLPGSFAGHAHVFKKAYAGARVEAGQRSAPRPTTLGRPALASAPRGPTSRGASKATHKTVKVSITKELGEFVDVNFDSRYFTDDRAPRNAFVNPKLTDTLIDAAVILEERALRLNKRTPWHVIGKLFPNTDVEFSGRKFHGVHDRALHREDLGQYRELLLESWEALWNEHGGKAELPDPNPKNVSEFDLGLYVRFLRTHVNKQALRQGHLPVEGEAMPVPHDRILPSTLAEAHRTVSFKEDGTRPAPEVEHSKGPFPGRLQKLASRLWSGMDVHRTHKGPAAIDDVPLRHAKMLVKSLETAGVPDEETIKALNGPAERGFMKLKGNRNIREVKVDERGSVGSANIDADTDAQPDNIVFARKWHDYFGTSVPARVLRDVFVYAEEFSGLQEAYECPVNLSDQDGMVAAMAHLLSSGKFRFEVDASVTDKARKALGYATRQAVDQDVENTVFLWPATDDDEHCIVPTGIALPGPATLPHAQPIEFIAQGYDDLKRRVDNPALLEMVWNKISGAGSKGLSCLQLFEEHPDLSLLDGLEVWFGLVNAREPQLVFIDGSTEAKVIKVDHVEAWTIPMALEIGAQGDNQEGDERVVPMYWQGSNGEMDEEAWTEAVNWVRGTLMTRPGLLASELVQRALGDILSFVEIMIILESLCQAGHVRPSYERDNDAIERPDVLWHSARWFLSYEAVSQRINDTMEED